MIISVEKLREHINTELDDRVLEDKLQALELLVRKYTNNNFQNRNIRYECSVIDQKLYITSSLLKVDDTVQISESRCCDGIYTVVAIDDNMVEVNEPLLDESHALVTLVKYPIDVQQGVVNLMKWDLENRDKVGIASETISRHSVTYFNMDGDNSIMGFPRSLMGFLKPYMKARF